MSDTPEQFPKQTTRDWLWEWVEWCFWVAAYFVLAGLHIGSKWIGIGILTGVGWFIVYYALGKPF